MDDAIVGGSAMVLGDLHYDKLAEEHIKHAVIAAYTNALKGTEYVAQRVQRGAARLSRASSRHFGRPRSPPGCANNLLCGSVTALPMPCHRKGWPQPPRRESLTRAAVETGTEKSGHFLGCAPAIAAIASWGVGRRSTRGKYSNRSSCGPLGKSEESTIGRLSSSMMTGVQAMPMFCGYCG